MFRRSRIFLIATLTASSSLAAGVLGSWTFDDTGATTLDRLKSVNNATGGTVSSLVINPTVDDFGAGVVPSGDNDGMGFGGNQGERTMFWHRAAWDNDTAPVGETTTWGVPGVDTGVDTTVAKAPMSFTVTADATHSITVESILVSPTSGSGGYLVHFQEAGQAAGGSNTSGGTIRAVLNAPVKIAAGTSGTFTVNWDSTALNTGHVVNQIDLRGTVTPVGALRKTVYTRYSDAAGRASPPPGWAFYWNAPDGWAPGVPGDLSTGLVTDRASWRPMVWGGGMWTADGDTDGSNSSPDDFIRILSTGGHPGANGSAPELDRHAIAVFTVDVAGDYQLGQAWIRKSSSNGDGVEVKIFAKGRLVRTIESAPGEVTHFEARMENLAVGDEIAVAVGPAGSSSNDTYQLDYHLALCDPTFDGLPVFEVAAYGGAGDGTTDDFDAIHAAVDAAKAAGGGIVRFDGNKTYRAIGDSTSETAIENVLDLVGTSNIKVEGNGASMLIHPPDRLAEISHSDNIEVDGFTVAYDPLPYFQGTVDAIDVGNLTVDLTVPTRYEAPAVGANTISPGQPFFARSFIPSAPGSRSGSGRHIYLDSTETIGGDPRKIRLHARDDMTANLQQSSGATELVVPDLRYGHRGNFTLVIGHSSRVKAGNILFRNAPHFVCAPIGNLGPVTLSNIDIMAQDPANELFVSWRDAFHVKNNRFAPLIERGDWHGGAMNDDLFNFSTMMTRVTSSSGHELGVAAPGGIGFQHVWRAGEWVAVWDPTQTILRGRARIVGPGSTHMAAATLTLDSAISASLDDWVVNESQLNRGLLVRSCTNHPLGTRTASSRLRTPSYFQDVRLDGGYLWLHTTTEHEGPRPRDFVFENVFIKGASEDPWLTEPIDIVGANNITFKGCTVDGGRIHCEDSSEVNFDGIAWTNNTGDVLRLQENSNAYVFRASTRNGSAVVPADVQLSSGAQVIFEEPPDYHPPLLPPLPDYDAWSANWPGADLDNPDADPDLDGLSNEAERRWGLDPTSVASWQAVVAPLDATGTFRYTRRDPALTGLTGLTYTVWTTTDLGSWTPDPGALQVPTPDTPVADVETVQVTLTPVAGPQLFFKVGAE